MENTEIKAKALRIAKEWYEDLVTNADFDAAMKHKEVMFYKAIYFSKKSIAEQIGLLMASGDVNNKYDVICIGGKNGTEHIDYKTHFGKLSELATLMSEIQKFAE